MTTKSTEEEYLLGVNQTELERLRFQHGVWGRVTEAFFDRLAVQRGWRCLDVGAGPGFVAMDLRRRVGGEGEVTVLEPSEFYLEWFKKESEKNGWANIRFLHGKAEDAALPEKHYDLIFARWVIGFVPDAEMFLTRLYRALRPGGIIALQDYVYEGLSFYPRGGAFDRMPDVVRAYWRLGGGDADIAARIPSMFKAHGLKLVDYHPNCLAGGPRSDVVEWAHRFFSVHIQFMADKGIISQKEGDAMLKDWLDHRNNPESIFFSPIVVDMAGQLPR